MQAAKSISQLEGPQGRNPKREEGRAWLCPMRRPLPWFLVLSPWQQCTYKPPALMGVLLVPVRRKGQDAAHDLGSLGPPPSVSPGQSGHSGP